MLIKQKNPSLHRNLVLGAFLRIANSVLNKGKSAIPPLFNCLGVLSSASEKTKLQKFFLRTVILLIQVSLYPFFLLELV